MVSSLIIHTELILLLPLKMYMYSSPFMSPVFSTQYYVSLVYNKKAKSFSVILLFLVKGVIEGKKLEIVSLDSF